MFKITHALAFVLAGTVIAPAIARADGLPPAGNGKARFEYLRNYAIQNCEATKDRRANRFEDLSPSDQSGLTNSPAIFVWTYFTATCTKKKTAAGPALKAVVAKAPAPKAPVAKAPTTQAQAKSN